MHLITVSCDANKQFSLHNLCDFNSYRVQCAMIPESCIFNVVVLLGFYESKRPEYATSKIIVNFFGVFFVR